jgi:hypothetical protein
MYSTQTLPTSLLYSFTVSVRASVLALHALSLRIQERARITEWMSLCFLLSLDNGLCKATADDRKTPHAHVYKGLYVIKTGMLQTNKLVTLVTSKYVICTFKFWQSVSWILCYTIKYFLVGRKKHRHSVLLSRLTVNCESVWWVLLRRAQNYNQIRFANSE